MLKLRDKILRFIILITLSVIAVVSFSALLFQFTFVKNNLYSESMNVLTQIAGVVDQNRDAQSKAATEYEDTLFNKADSVALIVSSSKEIRTSLSRLEKNVGKLIAYKGNYIVGEQDKALYDSLKNVARITDVDEIAVLVRDKDYPGSNAIVLYGTALEKIGYSMTDNIGEARFSDMLTGKGAARMIVSPSSDSPRKDYKQYAMVWTPDKNYLIEIGMNPTSIANTLGGYELSYLLSFYSSEDAVIYAFDRRNLSLAASSDHEVEEKDDLLFASDLGLNEELLQTSSETFRINMGGTDYFCVSCDTNDYYLVRMTAKETLLRNITRTEIILLVTMLIISVVLTTAVIIYINGNVIRSVQKINASLKRISCGNLEENVQMRDSLEFAELSDHINAMVKSLMSSTDTISLVLNQSEMHIGVYEYNEMMKRVRYTENLPDVLHIAPDLMHSLSRDSSLFKSYIENIYRNPSDSDKGVYRVTINVKGLPKEIYLKIEETSHNNGVLGIVADVTDEIEKLHTIEEERDVDILTGLYNRRAVERKLEFLFENYKDLGTGAMIMLDADGLKSVNDRYGHENGDVYLRALADVLRNVAGAHSVCGRIGGDEFLMFLYHFIDKAELDFVIGKLKASQENTPVSLTTGETIKLDFSFGYALSSGHSDYKILINLADEQMYRSKRKRHKKE